jgi:O-antigen/teichoic acid export membrane protein
MSEDEGGDSLSSLGSISHGAGLFFIGRVCRQGIRFITNLILTRTLGPSLYGIYAYLIVVFSLFSVFTRLGGDKSVLRYLPEYEDNHKMQTVMLTVAFITSLVASVIVSGLVYHFAPTISELTLEEPLFVNVLRVGAIVLPFSTLSNIIFSSFKAIERIEYNVAVSNIIQPILRLIFVGGAVLWGYSVIGAVAGLVFAGILTFSVSIAVLIRKTDLGLFQQPTRSEFKRYYDFSLPLTFNQIGSFLYNRVDVLMVGFLLSGAAVGVYNIAIMVAGILMLPLSAFNQLFPPIASKLYHRGDYTELENVYRTVTRWVFTISLFPGLAVILYTQEILQVFGEEFASGVLVLTLFTIAQLTNCLVGPSGFLLMMTEHQYLTMMNQLLSGFLNVVLNYLLILQYGLIGAAMATATILACINLLRVGQVWYLEGFFPYDRKYIKPITAGIVSAIIMTLISLVLSQYLLLLIGGATGAISFFGCLFLMGFEEEEVDIFERMVIS